MPAPASPPPGPATSSRMYDPQRARTAVVLDVLGGVAYLEDNTSGQRWTRPATELKNPGARPVAA